MGNVGADHYRCPRCGEVKPRTAEHFHFGRTGERTGRITGYCKPCQRSWWHEHYDAGLVVRRPHYARDWRRARLGTPPERYRHEATA